ncbi:hypothetical protein B0H17DRAFT_1052327 [Mycena rosella]|uniref:Uncharacterized protein n=1 Tax=Mycena rosella TaxID=1033263 RepID=A0AAD7DQA0_MYCRO|nr:hypothetical protein B0H17DRAFT_1052327 [Mycena rosella]
MCALQGVNSMPRGLPQTAHPTNPQEQPQASRVGTIIDAAASAGTYFSSSGITAADTPSESAVQLSGAGRAAIWI